MKLISALAFAGYATASFDVMNGQVKLGVQRAVMEARANGNRQLDLILGSSLDNIRNYGCWCFFLEDAGNGKSLPVDSVDKACKHLQHGYNCAVSDVFDATGDDSCDPASIPYNAGISFGVAGVVSSCNQLNSGLCEQFACIVEGVFVVEIIQAFLNIGTVNPDNLHSNGFDFKNGCPVSKDERHNDPTRLCCGELPYRFEYRPVDRDCCTTATFDPALQECCADGVPRFSCV